MVDRGLSTHRDRRRLATQKEIILMPATKGENLEKSRDGTTE